MLLTHTTDRCYGCNNPLTGRRHRIHKASALVYTHDLLKEDEVMRRKQALAMSMDYSNLIGSISGLAGVSATTVATLCGMAKFANATQLANRGI